MKHKINPNKMTPEELNKYVQDLPEEVPPKWSSVGLLAVLGLFGFVTFVTDIKTGLTAMSWVYLMGSICAIGGVGYLIYKILNFNQ